MKRNQRSLSLLPVLCGVACLILVICAYVVFFDVPHRVRDMFGDPAPSLSFWQRTRYALILTQKGKVLTAAPVSVMETSRFTIDPDEPIQSIAGRLQDSGLILDAETFITYLLYSGGDVLIKAGDFLIPGSSNALEIARIIQDPSLQEIPFTIIKGWRIEEIAESLASSGFSISPQEFLQISRIRPDGYAISADMPAPGNKQHPYPIEGFLLPDTYILPRETSVFTFITTVLVNFDSKITPELRGKIADQGLTFYDGLILASIIEREAFVEDEKPLIASVYLNRIRQGMKLEADPTVQYALGFQKERGGWWSAPLWEDDLLFSSPFNTYQNAGLPPGPICNPDLESIQAVAEPAQTSYLYFRAVCDGSNRHAFAQTFEEHLENSCP